MFFRSRGEHTNHYITIAVPDYSNRSDVSKTEMKPSHIFSIFALLLSSINKTSLRHNTISCCIEFCITCFVFVLYLMHNVVYVILLSPFGFFLSVFSLNMFDCLQWRTCEPINMYLLVPYQYQIAAKVTSVDKPDVYLYLYSIYKMKSQI